MRKLLRLPVVTKSGVKLGHVFDINLEVEGHCVSEYLVHGGLFDKENKIIKPNQVIKICEGRIIVDDALVSVLKDNKAQPQNQLPATSIGNIIGINED